MGNINNVDLDIYYKQLKRKKTEPEKLTEDVSVNDIIKSRNDKVRMKEERQKQKLSLRNKSFKLVSHLIFFQLVFFNIVVFMVLAIFSIDCPYLKDIPETTKSILLDFLKYYISATIVEMLGMLFFILRFYFPQNKKT